MLRSCHPHLVGPSEHCKFLSFAPVKSVWLSCPSLSLGIYLKSSLNVHLHHRGNKNPTEHSLKETENRRVQIAARKKQSKYSLKVWVRQHTNLQNLKFLSRVSFSQSSILASHWQFNHSPPQQMNQLRQKWLPLFWPVSHSWAGLFHPPQPPLWHSLGGSDKPCHRGLKFKYWVKLAIDSQRASDSLGCCL